MFCADSFSVAIYLILHSCIKIKAAADSQHSQQQISPPPPPPPLPPRQTQACVSSKHQKTFRARKAIFEIQSLSIRDKVLSPKTSANFLVGLRFYCLAFKRNENLISVGKQPAHNVNVAFRARKVFGSFEKRTPGPRSQPRSDSQTSTPHGMVLVYFI